MTEISYCFLFVVYINKMKMLVYLNVFQVFFYDGNSKEISLALAKANLGNISSFLCGVLFVLVLFVVC